ncbi:MAG: hypothetical protein V4760_03725 [Bdellovibrionota bacterium]
MSIARLAIWTLVLLFAVNAISAPSDQVDYALASKMISLPAKISIGDRGAVDFDKNAWREEKQPDGTQLLTVKAKADARVAVMRTPKGILESFSAYQMKPTKTESSISVAFAKDRMSAFTSCEEGETKSSPGRVCVTATPQLCHSLKSGEGLTPEILGAMDSAEMKALATILTLRGSDHQLDNMVKSGNRLGLKSALQTTKGQLIALAKQIAKETGKPMTGLANEKPRDPAQAKREADDKAIAKDVLEESLPRLKRACVDAGFTGA